MAFMVCIVALYNLYWLILSMVLIAFVMVIV